MPRFLGACSSPIVACCLLIALLLPAPASAQFDAATVLGTVKDSSGAVVSTPDPGTHKVPQSPAEIEKLRRAYLENFVKMLP